jgi:hypothetical protein
VTTSIILFPPNIVLLKKKKQPHHLNVRHSVTRLMHGMELYVELSVIGIEECKVVYVCLQQRYT